MKTTFDQAAAMLREMPEIIAALKESHLYCLTQAVHAGDKLDREQGEYVAKKVKNCLIKCGVESE